MLKYFFLILSSLALLFLNGCSTVHRDGPLPYPVDVSKIPDAVPKSEPLSKLGNMNHYRVSGKTYYVMRSSKGYSEIGTASWYGTLFHKKRTSSGERYDMLAMTAAHKTLPLPTYVFVTNLKNHRTVIVKVNDRGPFSGNRLIDLSYAAAKKLGVTARGTALVRVTAIDPARYSKQPSHIEYEHEYTSSQHQHRVQVFYLQVGVFQSKERAERLKTRLLAMTASPVEILHTKQKLYRVQIGPIHTAMMAKHLSKKLQTAGLSSHKIYI